MHPWEGFQPDFEMRHSILPTMIWASWSLIIPRRVKEDLVVNISHADLIEMLRMQMVSVLPSGLLLEMWRADPKSWSLSLMNPQIPHCFVFWWSAMICFPMSNCCVCIYVQSLQKAFQKNKYISKCAVTNVVKPVCSYPKYFLQRPAFISLSFYSI